MKRLLAAGATAIFQVTRSFRAGERGQLHNPEFTIVEWYRAGDDMQAGIDLLDELAQSLLGTPPAHAHDVRRGVSSERSNFARIRRRSTSWPPRRRCERRRAGRT